MPSRMDIPDRDLRADVCNFYLAEMMTVDDYRPAYRKLDTLSHELAKALSRYLEIAVGGEVRWCKDWNWEQFGPDIQEFFHTLSAHDFHRSKAWALWTIVYDSRDRAGKIDLLRQALAAFETVDWPSRTNVGGPAWITATRVLIDFLQGQLRDRTFVDRCWTLQHNNDFIFDKAWDVTGLHQVLTWQEKGQYSALVRYASQDMRQLWQHYMRSKREAFDETWLGR